ncbi:MAG: hypothetical protein PF694_10890 [Bacteroidetes bacterium]|jgi:hypothetical protein|nr:hypothetical protein [Bacteroidota bacterium]
MIRFLRHSEIDKLKWDSCIKTAFNGNLYAWSWYLDIVHPEWNALIENNYERVFPLTGKSKFGLSYLFQPFFAQQLGVFSNSILNPNIIAAFLDAIPLNYRFAEIRLNTHNKLEESAAGLSWHRNHELDLINSYQKLYKNYSANTKRNLKKAAQYELQLAKNVRPEEVIQLFRENRGRTISHWNDLEYNRLKHLTYTGIYRGQASVYGVYSKPNELCAGAIFMRSHGKLIFLFSGANQYAKETHALSFLIDQVIQAHCPGNLVFDFEGSDQAGLARYYKGFGSKETYYPGIKINRLPFLGRIALRVVKRK